VESNAQEIERIMMELVAGFNFTVKGKDSSLGKDLAGLAAEGIVDRSVPDAIAPDGSAWPANEERYAKRKAGKYDAHQPGQRTGQMLSKESVMGETVVGADVVEMRYGTATPPTSAANGTELTQEDMDITDIEKAFFFSKERPFYGLDQNIADTLGAEAGEALGEYLDG
jgi:hypothetical protein